MAKCEGAGMKKYLASRNSAFFAAGGLTAGFFIAGAAYAVTDTVFRYDPPKTGFLMIPGSAFVPNEGSATQWSMSPGYLIQGTSPGDEICFSAPVNLPDRSELRSVRVWYAKSDAGLLTYQLQARDSAQNFGVGAVILSRTPPSTDFNTASVSNNISDQTIMNARYAYFFRACMDGGAQLFGIRITYVYSTAGD
jgi:hypothetical protein